jgi:hypothetical protein
VRDFGGKTPKAEAHTIIDYALDAGEHLNISLTEEDHHRIDCICTPGKTLVSYYYEDSSADFRPSQYRW